MSGLNARMRNEGEVLVVQLSGRIDIESAPPFRKACQDQLRARKIVFDFLDLNFVGSAGILPFLEVLDGFAAENPGHIKFANVGLEFRRVLSATTLNAIEMWDRESQAIEAFSRLSSGQMASAPSVFGIQSTDVSAGAAPTPLASSKAESTREN